MTEFWRFTLLGLGLGGIYALAAQGIVLVYRGSGVLNFAHGAFAAVAAFVYAEAAEAGWSPWVAAYAGLAAASTAGAVVQVAVMRPLRHSSALSRVVATLGVLTVLQAALIGWPFNFGSTQRFVPGLLPTGPLPFRELGVSQDRAWIVAIAGITSLMLWAVYRFTRFGIVTRAIAENAEAAAALGRSADLVATANWAAGAALAGLAGILVGPIIGLSVNQILLLLIPALAAALVGGFVSFPATLAGGLLIGLLETQLSSGSAWIPGFFQASGWPKAVPFVVIIAVLTIRGRGLPSRGHVVARMPRVGTGRVHPGVFGIGVIVTAALVAGIEPVGFGGVHMNWVAAITTTLTAATIGLSLVVVTGYAGQLSLAQYALAGMGAYVAARLASGSELFGLFGLGRVDFLPAALLGVLFTVPVGLLVGLPALRTRGVDLAVATLGLALLIERVVLDNPDFTGGFDGTVVPTPSVLGLSLDPVAHPRRYALFCLAAFTLCALVVANLRRGRSGRRLLAVRTNERAAASLAISVPGAKLYAFGLAAGIASVGGVLQAFRSRTVLFTPFDVANSIQVVVQTVLGGVGFIAGAVIGGGLSPGGAMTFVLDELLSMDVVLVGLLSGVLLVATLILWPDGIAAQVARMMPIRQPRRRPEQPTAEDAQGPVTTRPKTLVVRGIDVQFGGVLALQSVSLELRPGTIVGLIGPNGAGKTTLIDAVSGFARTGSGVITLDGLRVDAWGARRRAAAGVGRSFQSLELFEDMSVRDNLRTAADRSSRLAYLADLVWPRNPPLSPAANAAIREFGLRGELDCLPGELPYGRRRLVAIARAVAANPSVLLLDEPAAGLDDHETAELGTLLRRLASEWNLAILLVEHDVGLVVSVCDRVVALDAGRVIAEGTPPAVRDAPQVVAAYLGDDECEAVGSVPTPTGGTAR